MSDKFFVFRGLQESKEDQVILVQRAFLDLKGREESQDREESQERR